MTEIDIWVDCDGVLADFGSAYLRMLGYITGRRHDLADITSFDFAECVATKAEDEQVWRAIDKSPGLVASLAPIAGAEQGLAALRSIGRVRCLTSPHFGPFWMHERCEWLARLGFKKRDIVFAADKSLVPGHVLVDDRPDGVLDWARRNSTATAVLFDAPYNRGQAGLDHVHNVVRAVGWDSVALIVAVLAHEAKP